MNKNEIKLIWLEPTNEAQRIMRRYAGVQNEKRLCPSVYKYHNAHVILGVNTAVFQIGEKYLESLPMMPDRDKRWPVKCDSCDYEFTEDDHYQHHQELLYQRRDNGELVTLKHAPLGSMWDAWWCNDIHKAPDGLCVMLKTPGGDWMVDGIASNCKARNVEHQCWPRTGNPKDPQGNPPLNVAGNGGCKVGAGSIKTNNYHGFLNKGYLRTRRI